MKYKYIIFYLLLLLIVLLLTGCSESRHLIIKKNIINNTFINNNSNGTPAGSDGAVQFNNNGSFGGNTSLLYLNKTNGYVGVKTNTPIAELEVNGSLLVNGEANFLVNGSNGFVGINTTNPLYPIHKIGNTPTYPTALIGSFNTQSFSDQNGFMFVNSYWNGSDVIILKNGRSAGFQFSAGRILFRTDQVLRTAGDVSPLTTQMEVNNAGVLMFNDVNIADGNVTIDELSSNYTGGSAFICVDDNGKLFASESSCL